MSVTQVHAGAGRAITLPRCSLRVTSGDQTGTERTIDGDLFRLGKGHHNDLVLRDSTVSREHCEIVRDSRGYLLRDLGSTNGTLIDGSEIREGYLRAGVVITVGRVELEVRPFDERIEVRPGERTEFGEMVGQDPAMRAVFAVLERVAATDATLLIGGETGTGKDVLARAVHAESRRKGRPFIVVDCGAVVGSLIESELFGHEKGAFTGAAERRQGAFELAHRGTIFLDEVGELPLSLQTTLLRVLETRRIRRVGGQEEIPVDIRVIAATNRNLELEVQRGKFREDLYYRLAVVPVTLPPLRERRADIPPLAAHLLSTIHEEYGLGPQHRTLGASALAALQAHDWPGNVRELRNVLQRAVLLTQASDNQQLDLGGALGGSRSGGDSPPQFDPAESYRDTRARFEADFEKRYVSWLLGQHEGNVSAAARAADMDRKYLHKLAKKHGLK
ncbi:MAG: sigma 54-interacting transcriptional regulator [Myxococcales bacterium]